MITDMRLGNLFILGAGRPHKGDQPSALVSAGPGPALNWVIGAVEGRVGQVHFVGGYHADEVRARYPGLSFSENPDWARTGSAGSLLYAPVERGSSCLVCYGDVVFRDNAVRELMGCAAPVGVAIDRRWRQRYSGRTQADIDRCEKVITGGGRVLRLGQDLNAGLADAEFVGLVMLRPEAVDRVLDLAERFPDEVRAANLSSLVEWLRLSGLEVEAVDVMGDWAELNEPQDLARFVMGTKAETLARLRGSVSRSVIQDQISFTFGEWTRDGEACRCQVRDRFGAAPLVVRSSSGKEDSFSAASAGVYTSLLNVDPETGLADAVGTVFASYGDPHDGEQVLIQPFISSVAMHGVVFTRTLDRGAPYYVINYDMSGDTEAITSGTSTESHTLIVHRDLGAGAAPEAPFDAVLAAVRELESLLAYDALDIEFAVDRDGQVHIFQARPIAVGWDEPRIDGACEEVLAQARSTWKRLAPTAPFIPAGAPVFGVMPDWNPAEIIGTAPRALSESLYRSLIMDEVWAAQRAEYGYRDVRPQPLLASFGGRAYVDVRASFTSFVPADLDAGLAGRLVSFYLDWLKRNPHLHDKVEFDVVPTCYSLDFSRWQTRFSQDGGFTAAEIEALEDGLRRITGAAFSRTGTDLATVEGLRQRFDGIGKAQGINRRDRARIYLDDCRRLGTLPFAHLARAGFVAVTLLRSAADTGVIGRDAVEALMSSLNTVTRQFSRDVAAAAEGRLTMEDLVERYGHLRPGTYDITSSCYASDAATYLAPLVAEAAAAPHEEDADPAAWLRDREAFFAALGKAGLPDDPETVETFLREAIAGRELAKFHFTRNLSAALEELALYGEEIGLSREQLADLPIDAILSAPEGAEAAQRLRDEAEAGARAHKAAAACPMPALLTAESDFTMFRLMATQPNFVGTTRVRAEVVCLDAGNPAEGSLKGKVVLIPQADPGYDWLFGQSIAALVTMYGGANSHMAIRSAEFRLPAAIGVGERLYAELSKARLIELDPANQRIQGVS